ncbi:hypothetical protein PF005_g29246 [Phytophthora fragariae]|uniref:Secreted protein n=1 Tax=Phytophthora fragariae TaxID=53985 RepID=A0A6A3PW45_9STRA|nr:hypothetical protein PF009_g29691 [Phytophthora fragariae]KAE9063826.1 hypothetical protein PF010_g28842 [Phytophthora fragariae]KAE9064689.1 hypothetical protein PF007_g29104 [Phytophthora fragariae]KAE9072356.1 hypothetical protein PF006_g28949 [Phytophthora fragariae]KAE9166317.1 hypothetical protein PF005_g29246 [Phytophthora fragariae]
MLLSKLSCIDFLASACCATSRGRAMCWSTRATVVCCLYTCAWPRQKKMQVTEIGYGLILLQYNNHHQNRGVSLSDTVHRTY